MARRITFLAKPYQKQGNGSELDILSSRSQETLVTTGNMQSPIGSAVARRPLKTKVTLHQEVVKSMVICPPSGVLQRGPGQTGQLGGRGQEEAVLNCCS